MLINYYRAKENKYESSKLDTILLDRHRSVTVIRRSVSIGGHDLSCFMRIFAPAAGRRCATAAAAFAEPWVHAHNDTLRRT